MLENGHGLSSAIRIICVGAEILIQHPNNILRLYLLGRHFSFEPNNPTTYPAHPTLYSAIVSFCSAHLYFNCPHYMLAVIRRRSQILGSHHFLPPHRHQLSSTASYLYFHCLDIQTWYTTRQPCKKEITGLPDPGNLVQLAHSNRSNWTGAPCIYASSLQASEQRELKSKLLTIRATFTSLQGVVRALNTRTVPLLLQ